MAGADHAQEALLKQCQGPDRLMLTDCVDGFSSLSGKNVPRALEGTPGGSPYPPLPEPPTER